MRVWQVPPAHWLSGGLGLLPLAPLGDVRPEQLPAVIAQVKQRLEREAPPSEAADLWSAVYILMGLRYEQALIQPLLQGVLAMKESVTYQAILQEGKSEEARRMLLLFGRDKLGEPSAAAQTALDTLTDVNHLEELAQHIHRATSWDELLGLASPEPRSPRRKRRS